MEMYGNLTNHSSTELRTKHDFNLVTSTWPEIVVILTAVFMIIVDVTTIIGNAFVIGALAKIDALKTMANYFTGRGRSLGGLAGNAMCD